MTRTDGIDLSHYQTVAWPAVPQYQFVACKASQGVKADPKFATNWAAMRERGFVCRVAYHFLDKSATPAAQAAYFQNMVGPLQQGETLALDFEQAGVTANDAVAFMNALRLPVGHQPLFYAGEFFPGSHDERLQGYPLWMPGYTAKLTSSRHVVVWQWLSTSSVPGVAGHVDVNEIEDLPALRRACGYASQQFTPIPAPPEDEPMQYFRNQDNNKIYGVFGLFYTLYNGDQWNQINTFHPPLTNLPDADIKVLLSGKQAIAPTVPAI